MPSSHISIKCDKIVCFEGVLDEGDDELMNVNLQDSERVEKNLENKKKKPTYNPYDMEEDEYGMVGSLTYTYTLLVVFLRLHVLRCSVIIL